MTQLEPLAPEPEAAPEPHAIIRSIRLAHCKRGPARCEECRRLDADRFCLLETFPPQSGDGQRRLIHLEGPGGGQWRAFDVVRIFASEAEARAYATQHGIDIRLD
jgi:hypothetical protein